MSETAAQKSVLHITRQSPIATGVKEIITLVDDPHTSVAKLASAIYKNQMLMERVLRQANSPLYGFPRRVSDPNFAVVLLGFDALKELVIRSVVTGAFRRMVNSLLRFEAFWNHSVSCGLGARLIAEETGACDPSDAFVAGLLHDVGYIVLSESGSERTQGAALALPKHSLPEIGNAPIQEYHASVGAWLVEQWKVSEAIVDAIRHHHQPVLAQKDRPLTAVVHVAEVLCHHLRIGECSFESATSFDQAALDELDLSRENLTGGSPSKYSSLLLEKLSHAPKFESLVRDLKNNLIEAMEELSEQERLMLALLYHEGLSFPEIAKVLGITIADVERLQETALARLRAAVSLMT